jgi:cytochrome b involved in lipid metabolism
MPPAPIAPVLKSRYTEEELNPSPVNKVTETTLTVKSYREKRIITKILGMYYDLTDFKHPGGPIAIACADDRDATELFMSHHLFSEKDIKSILGKY